jgi:Zn-dependent protease with chaperone function
MNVRYVDGQTSAEHTAEVEITPLGLRIHYVDTQGSLQEVFWSADDLAPAVVQPGRPVFLRRKGQLAPHVRFERPEDFARVTAAYPRRHLIVGKQATNQFSSTPSAKRIIILVLAGLLVVGLIGYAGLEVLGRVVVNLAPTSWDEQVGQTLYEQLVTQGQVSENTQASEVAQRFFEEAGFESKFNVRIHVDRTAVVNAYALPGGQIIVNEGLISNTQTADELAGVLAHELGHVEKRHTFQHLARMGVLYVAVSAALGDVNGILTVIAQNGQAIFGLTYSRKMETEADQFALNLLLKEEIKPTGLISFFTFLEKEEKANKLQVPQLLRTHPATPERIANIRELIPAKYQVDAEREETLTGTWSELKGVLKAPEPPPIPEPPSPLEVPQPLDNGSSE